MLSTVVFIYSVSVVVVGFFSASNSVVAARHIPPENTGVEKKPRDTASWNTLKFNGGDLLSQQQYRSLETCLFDRANPRRVKVVIFLSMSNANAAP